MNNNKVIAVTNRHLTNGEPLDAIRKIAAAGPRALILREKDLPEEAYAAMARQALEICRDAGVQLFVHSHIGIAREIGCRAVHLSISLLRQILNAAEQSPDRDLNAVNQSPASAGVGSAGGWIERLEAFDAVSISCHSIEEVREAVAAGAAQIVLGNIFETDCKKGKPGRGLDFLREAAEAASPVPVYGIGGITPENLDAVLQTGAAGGCMMSWWYR